MTEYQSKKILDLRNHETYQTYLKEISRFKPLSMKEIRIKYDEYKEGNKNAINDIIESHLYVVVRIVNKYFLNTKVLESFDIMDLIDMGNIALNKLVYSYDYNKAPFQSYINDCIFHQIHNQLVEEKYPIRIPVYRQIQINSYNRKLNALAISLGRFPTKEEIITNLSITEEMYNLFEQILRLEQIASINTHCIFNTPEEDVQNIGDNYKEERFEIYKKSEIEIIFEKLLDERRVFVLDNKYGFKDGKKSTNIKIGNALNVSASRIDQLHTDSLAKLEKSNEIQMYIKDNDPHLIVNSKQKKKKKKRQKKKENPLI